MMIDDIAQIRYGKEFVRLCILVLELFKEAVYVGLVLNGIEEYLDPRLYPTQKFRLYSTHPLRVSKEVRLSRHRHVVPYGTLHKDRIDGEGRRQRRRRSLLRCITVAEMNVETLQFRCLENVHPRLFCIVRYQ